MSVARGTVVISRAGRDKGRPLAVLCSDDRFASLADGKLRRLEKPKRKKLIHLAVTKNVLSSEELATDRQLRKALATRLNSKASNIEEA